MEEGNTRNNAGRRFIFVAIFLILLTLVAALEFGNTFNLIEKTGNTLTYILLLNLIALFMVLTDQTDMSDIVKSVAIISLSAVSLVAVANVYERNTAQSADPRGQSAQNRISNSDRDLRFSDGNNAGSEAQFGARRDGELDFRPEPGRNFNPVRSFNQEELSRFPVIRAGAEPLGLNAPFPQYVLLDLLSVDTLGTGASDSTPSFNYRISAKHFGEGGDPVIALFRATAEITQINQLSDLEGAEFEIIDEDDDSGNGLNSLIERTLRPSLYLLEVQNIGNPSNGIGVSVRRHDYETLSSGFREFGSALRIASSDLLQSKWSNIGVSIWRVSKEEFDVKEELTFLLR